MKLQLDYNLKFQMFQHSKVAEDVFFSLYTWVYRCFWYLCKESKVESLPPQRGIDTKIPFADDSQNWFCAEVIPIQNRFFFFLFAKSLSFHLLTLRLNVNQKKKLKKNFVSASLSVLTLIKSVYLPNPSATAWKTFQPLTHTNVPE